MPHSIDLDRTAINDRQAGLEIKRFIPRPQFHRAIEAFRNDEQVFGRLKLTGRDELSCTLWEMWHRDDMQPRIWTSKDVDALSLLTSIAPDTWRELHAELVVLSMLHRGPARFPHARLLQELDTRWDEQH
jgi:hypothetical protein